MKRIILFISILCASVTAIAQETKSQLVTRFDVIRNETAVGGNTKARIANAYQELSDGMIGVYPIEATGTNTYSGSLIGIDGYNKRIFFVTFQNNNTGASTLNINSIGAVAIQKDVSGTWTALSSNDILAGKLYQLFHDGTRLQIDLGGSGSGVITASNGLTRTGDDIKLGGTVTENTSISSGANNISITGDNATFELPQDGLSPINIISNNGVNLADAAGAGLSYQSADGLGDAVSATIFPTSYTIEGPSSFPGVQYAANYGVNFTARSIPDVGFLDGRYTSSQGITKTGTNFTLGGTFSSNISLNSNTANTNSFTIGGTTRPNTIQFLAGDVIGNNSGAITINSTTTSISRTTTNPMSLVLSSSGMVVTDLAFTKGLTYAADYSTNFSGDNRSIPDVGWVNSQINNNAWPLTGTRAFTGNAVIDGGGFNATIGQSGNRMGNFRVWSNGTIGLDASTTTFLQAGASTIHANTADVVINAPTVEATVDTDYRFYNTVNNNFATWGSAGYSVNLDEVDGAGSFAVNDSDSPFFVIGALGDITFHSVPEYDVAPTLSNDLQLTHKLYVDSKAPLAMPSVTYTANRIAGTADIGKIIYMNVTTANTFTINSGVFPVGTFLNVRVLDEATTAVEGASVTINAQSGSLVLNSSGINVFYQTSADVWELYNGSPFTLQNTTLTGLVTWTMGGNGLLLSGGDLAVTGTGGYQFSFDDDNGTNIDFPTNATGDLYFRKSTGFLDRLPIGSAGQVLTVSGGLPSWQAAGGVSDGDKGDITVSASGATWTVDNSTITYAKMQNAAGGTRIIGRSAASAGGLNEIVFTADGQVLRRAGGTLGPGAVDLADADAVTGVLPTANGGSLSGTYTPTLTGETNIDATTAFQCQYMRVGNVVTVSGQFDADVTSSASSSQVGISLPIASNFTASYNAGGTSAGFSINTAGTILADLSNDRAQVTWVSTTTSNNTYSFQFSYLVQ